MASPDAVEAYVAAARTRHEPGEWVLPLPQWRLRPYDHDGAEAWAHLRGLVPARPPDRAMAVYLHVPFCASKCGFCDSYSFAVGDGRRDLVDAYARLLDAELALWSGLGVADRPVSTVHFGGGTPTRLGALALTALTRSIRGRLGVTDATEWALETTASSLSPPMLDALDDAGFRRLHVGVQTLAPAARAAAGRVSTAEGVLDALERALARGWVVTVDLVCGLPGQEPGDTASDIATLAALGVDGFSVYELLVYPSNRRWADAHGVLDPGRHERNLRTFVAAALALDDLGLTKNVFNHWSGPRDRNVYFTFPSRGEDLLALGAIADGVLGDYHYRHHRYPEYRRGVPGLEGGLTRPLQAALVAPAVTGILGGRLDAAASALVAGLPGGSELIAAWRDARLVEPDAAGGLALSPTGSWFAGNLVRDVSALAG